MLMSAPPLFARTRQREVFLAHDGAAVDRILRHDPVGACMVAARMTYNGVAPRALGGQLWMRHHFDGALVSDGALCYVGDNIIPVCGAEADMYAFADEALNSLSRCSSIVGRVELVLPLWERLEPGWGPAREVRQCQPLLALTTAPSCAPDASVRQVQREELDAYLLAAVDMFIAEVGVDPRGSDGGRGYRRRLARIIAEGRAYARFEHGDVVFKAEVGSQSSRVGQIQGVWVHPQRRCQGLGSAGTAAVAAAVVHSGRVASLYVNSFNKAALATYARVGFTEVGTFASVLVN